jgi:hypothetical protein
LITNFLVAVAPHASFSHPGCPEKFQPRESIEARALVFSYPQASS